MNNWICHICHKDVRETHWTNGQRCVNCGLRVCGDCEEWNWEEAFGMFKFCHDCPRQTHSICKFCVPLLTHKFCGEASCQNCSVLCSSCKNVKSNIRRWIKVFDSKCEEHNSLSIVEPFIDRILQDWDIQKIMTIRDRRDDRLVPGTEVVCGAPLKSRPGAICTAKVRDGYSLCKRHRK